MTRFRILLTKTICPAMLGLVASSGLANGAQAGTAHVDSSANAAPIRAEQDLPPPIELSDVRTYRHCHNTPRRTYCHTKERLPIRVPAVKSSATPRRCHAS
jgi:hypothetical protein